MTKPIVENHNGVLVVRDELFEGGTKARFIPLLFDCADEVVYASPAEGGAQSALATVAGQLGKRATIFVAERKREKWHARTLMAERLGATIKQVPHGYLQDGSETRRRVQPPHGRPSSAVWLRYAGSRTSYCSGGALHRGRAR